MDLNREAKAYHPPSEAQILARNMGERERRYCILAGYTVL